MRRMLIAVCILSGFPLAAFAQFEPQPGITLIALDGVIEHGARIRIEDSQARFGTRGNSTPWLFDSVARVLLGGVASTPYAGLADGTVVPETVWQWRSSEIANQGTHVDNPVRVASSRTTRHAFAQRQYAGVAPSDSAPMNKTILAFPRYPADRPRARALYLSFWLRYRYGIAGLADPTLAQHAGHCCTRSLLEAVSSAATQGKRKRWLRRVHGLAGVAARRRLRPTHGRSKPSAKITSLPSASSVMPSNQPTTRGGNVMPLS